MGNVNFDIKQGIKAHIINTDSYKTNVVCVILTVPLTRQDVTKNAIIPFMLRRGTEKYPNQYIISKELENMYGASFECGIDKFGDNQIFKFYIDVINNDYVLDKENILEKAINMILDIVFNPLFENGCFKEEFLKVEKESLRKVINSKIDDKDFYAFENCISSMYGQNGFGLYKYGYIEDLEKISAKELTDHYNKMIQSSKIDIYVSGDFNKDEILEILNENPNIQKLIPRTESYILNNEFTESKQIVEKENIIQDKMNVTQGKLVIGLDVLSKQENLHAASLVYNAILGDGVNSKLFQNVREKAGLAYSAKSTFVKQKLNIFIRCGIQIENYDRALDLIKIQLESIKNGDFTEEDIQNSKSYLISGIKTVKEEQDTEIVFYIGQEIAKTNMELEEYIEKIEKVSKEDILNIARQIQINTIYFLRD